MEDFIAQGTGNSRFLKSVANAMTLYPTYESFIAALVAGTFPVDLNGINPAGVEQMGTRLGKATLLSDETAALFGLSATAVPNDVLNKIGLSKLAIGSYKGTGTTGTAEQPNELIIGFRPKLIEIFYGASMDQFEYSADGYVLNTLAYAKYHDARNNSFSPIASWSLNASTILNVMVKITDNGLLRYISPGSNEQQKNQRIALVQNKNGATYDYIAFG